jgi:CheY-like chemotaxis protein
MLQYSIEVRYRVVVHRQMGVGKPMAHRILVVDDDPNALRLISYALHREGFEVIPAQNGPEALKLVIEQPPDLVVLDVMMPQMDGYEVCRQLRENPATARLPVIMLTAKSQVEDKVRGFKAGADDYVTKPVLPAELVARVRALLVRSSYLAEPVSNARGRVFAFLGAKGGVGVTTLAVNVAIDLSDHNKSVILVDLNHAAGAVAMQLGLAPGQSLLPMLKDHTTPPTARSVTSNLLLHPSGIKVFPAPSRADVLGLDVEEKTIQAILEELTAQAEYVVIDAGHCLNPVSFAGITAADRLVIVTESDFLSLELVKHTLNVVGNRQRRGTGIDIVMVNRTRSATVISKTEAEEYLKAKLAHFIIPAPEMCFQSNRNRIPIMISQPGNLTVEQIRELAEHLTQK